MATKSCQKNKFEFQGFARSPSPVLNLLSESEGEYISLNVMENISLLGVSMQNRQSENFMF